MSLKLLAGLLTMTLSAGFVIPTAAQEVLPFPLKPSGSTAERRMQESIKAEIAQRVLHVSYGPLTDFIAKMASPRNASRRAANSVRVKRTCMSRFKNNSECRIGRILAARSIFSRSFCSTTS